MTVIHGQLLYGAVRKSFQIFSESDLGSWEKISAHPTYITCATVILTLIQRQQAYVLQNLF